MIPAPLFLVITPLILAFIPIAFSRWPKLVAACGVASTLILATVLTNVIVDSPTPVGDGLISNGTWEIFGRTLILTGQIQTTLLLVLAILAVLFLLTLLFHQGSAFVPVSLALMSPMAAVLMIRPFLFGAASLVIVAAMLAILVQGGRVGSTLAALRLLTMAVLAVPLLLIAGWMVDSGQSYSVTTVARLFLISFVILLAGFPFHIWVAPIVTESKSLVPVVVFGLAQIVIMLFCYNLLLDNVAIGLNTQFIQLTRASAVGTVIMGGVLALTARSFGRLLGYVILVDVGSLIFSFTISGARGLELTLSLVILRIMGLLIAGFGLCLLRHRLSPAIQGSDRLAAANYLMRRSPLGMVLFLYGNLSLIGLPLTPGFSGRWALILLAGEQSTWLATILLLSMAIATVGVLRFLLASLNIGQDSADTSPAEPVLVRIVASIMLGTGILFSIFPQILLDIARTLAQFS